MFKDTQGVKFVMGLIREKESRGPSFSKIKEYLKDVDPVILTLLMRWIIERLVEETGDDNFKMEIGGKWFLSPMVTGMPPKLPEKDPLGGCVSLGNAGGKLAMDKLLNLLNKEKKS